MKTILIGNGFNIELGGADYLNSAIINRFIKNAKTKDYATLLYNNTVSNCDLAILLDGLYEELKKILNGQYDRYCKKDEDKKLVSLLQGRYSMSVKKDEVGMEDYFVILRLFHIRFNDDEDMIKNTHDGFCWQFLDAIYNEGQIQTIANTVLPAYRAYLKKKFDEYDNIYTVNYDKTVELIAERSVNYLHGNFETLLDQYDANTPIGAYYQQKGIKNPVTDSTRHIYCNGLMGFSGTYKKHIMDIMNNSQFGVQNILKMYEEGMSIQDLKKIERLKQSSNQEDQFVFGIINAVVNNPNLKMRMYPMKEFKAVQGEIHLLGISPFNDEHLWNAIINNRSIYEIVYYYHSETAQKEMEEHFSDTRIKYLPDTVFWEA